MQRGKCRETSEVSRYRDAGADREAASAVAEAIDVSTA
jgi:hypothetical protein